MIIDRDTIIQAAATLFVLCALGFLVVLALRIWHQRRPSTRTVVMLGPAPITADQETDLIAVLKALDRAVMRLEQDEAYQREQALWNDGERLDECHAVQEAELVAEQYLHRLEKEFPG